MLWLWLSCVAHLILYLMIESLSHFSPMTCCPVRLLEVHTFFVGNGLSSGSIEILNKIKY